MLHVLVLILMLHVLVLILRILVLMLHLLGQLKRRMAVLGSM